MAGKSDTIGVNAMTLASRQFQTELQRAFQEILDDVILCVLNLKDQMCSPDDTCRVETDDWCLFPTFGIENK